MKGSNPLFDNHLGSSTSFGVSGENSGSSNGNDFQPKELKSTYIRPIADATPPLAIVIKPPKDEFLGGPDGVPKPNHDKYLGEHSGNTHDSSVREIDFSNERGPQEYFGRFLKNSVNSEKRLYKKGWTYLCDLADGTKVSFRYVSSKNGPATLTISHSPTYKNQKIKLVVKKPSVIIIKEK